VPIWDRYSLRVYHGLSSAGGVNNTLSKKAGSHRVSFLYGGLL
jgi:hypothetical protein